MPQYEVSLSPAGEEINLLLQGPGIQEDGRVYVFANLARCAAFAEAVNFAYRQGVRDGMRRANAASSDRLLVVAGRHPDSLCVRTETWWEALKRRFSGLGSTVRTD